MKRGAKQKRRWIWGWAAVVLVGGGAVFASLRFGSAPPVEVPVARVERGELIISVKGLGEIKSTRSVTIAAPQAPDSRIVRLAESGKPIKKGDVVVEFDPATQEQQYIEKNSSVKQAESEIVQAQAQQHMVGEQDATVLMQSQYNVERAKLEAGKQEILSEIQGAKNRIDVGIAEGELAKAQTTIEAHKQADRAELARLGEKKDKSARDANQAKSYLERMVLRAPTDGMVRILPNFRGGGGGGDNAPPFKAGDRVWPGAAIAQVPDVSEMRMEFRLEEVDRGLAKVGQAARIRVDALPDLEMEGTVEWISPIAELYFRTWPPEKNFPVKASIKKLDPRLRPGMSATAEIIIERQQNTLLIPLKASLEWEGQPAVFLQQGNRYVRRHIQAGKRSATDLAVLAGLSKGQVVALENPEEAAKKRLNR